MIILSLISTHPLTFIGVGLSVAVIALALRALVGLGGDIDPERWSGQ